MRVILILDVETDAPSEILQDESSVFVEINKNGLVWKPKVSKVQMITIDQGQERKAIESPWKKAVGNFTPFNMGMHTGMSLVGESD